MIQYLAARFVLFTLEYLPVRCATFYTKLLDLTQPRLRRVAMRNLALAYPEKTEEERRRIVDGVFRSLARLIAVFARFPRLNRANIGEWIEYEGARQLS